VLHVGLDFGVIEFPANESTMKNKRNY
jgi:hypothetical protein